MISSCYMKSVFLQCEIGGCFVVTLRSGQDARPLSFRLRPAGLGVEMIPALGESFDPNRHNAVMHCDDEEAGESTIVEVFQQGFLCGDKVIFPPVI